MSICDITKIPLKNAFVLSKLTVKGVMTEITGFNVVLITEQNRKLL